MITDKDIAALPPSQQCVGNHEPTFMASITRFVDHYQRRDALKEEYAYIEKAIRNLLCWKFISYPAEAEFIEAAIVNCEPKNILEVGMYTGFTTLHMIRAALLIGAKVTSIDSNRCFPEDVFARYMSSGVFRFVHGHTPEILPSLHGEIYDLVFVDSDHSPKHTESELRELWNITRPGTVFLFHDLPRIQHPGARDETEIRKYINGVAQRGMLMGAVLPSCFRVDMAIACGKVEYDRGINPHMGVFIRP